MAAGKAALQALSRAGKPVRVLSGIQCTGVPHLGNYLGALKQWVELQSIDHADIYYSAMDLHTITVPHEPDVLRRNIERTVRALLAVGVDPERSCFFRQSHVKEHTELTWILGCHASAGVMSRMTQWKSKSKKQQTASLGLFNYPVLMAADILLYNATHVPVGEDQTQHLELTRDLASAINERFGEAIFTIPAAYSGPAPRLMSLRKPTEKMSKSDRSDLSRVNLDDPAELIAKKIRKAQTDALGPVTIDRENRPGVTNLVNMYAALSDEHGTAEAVVAAHATTSLESFKASLGDLVVQKLQPIQDRMAELEADPGYVEQVLASGAERARACAADTVSRLKTAMGLA